jgi:hypothetical protein
MKTILTALLAALQAAEPSSQENGTAIQCEEQGVGTGDTQIVWCLF